MSDERKHVRMSAVGSKHAARAVWLSLSSVTYFFPNWFSLFDGPSPVSCGASHNGAIQPAGRAHILMRITRTRTHTVRSAYLPLCSDTLWDAQAYYAHRPWGKRSLLKITPAGFGFFLIWVHLFFSRLYKLTAVSRQLCPRCDSLFALFNMWSIENSANGENWRRMLRRKKKTDEGW